MMTTRASLAILAIGSMIDSCSYYYSSVKLLMITEVHAMEVLYHYHIEYTSYCLNVVLYALIVFVGHLGQYH